MYSGTSTKKPVNSSAESVITEDTETAGSKDADTSKNSDSTLEDDLNPSSTTTIRDENGNVTTYDENGSEIPTPSSHASELAP